MPPAQSPGRACLQVHLGKGQLSSTPHHQLSMHRLGHALQHAASTAVPRSGSSLAGPHAARQRMLCQYNCCCPDLVVSGSALWKRLAGSNRCKNRRKRPVRRTYLLLSPAAASAGSGAGLSSDPGDSA